MRAIRFGVEHWSAWAPGLETQEDWRNWVSRGARIEDIPGEPEKPRLDFMPPMLRRRASRVSRAALQVARECNEPGHNTRTIFASRHGELHRSTRLLTELAHAQPLSPNAFSLSVHNSAAGLYSIATGNRAGSTALAAGQDSLPAAVMAASGYLQRGEPAVTVVMADEAPPEFYRRWADYPPGVFALGLRLVAATADEGWQLQRDAGDQPLTELPAELALMALLAGGGTRLVVPGEGHSWLWERC